MKRRASSETGRSARAGAAFSFSKAAVLTAAFAVSASGSTPMPRKIDGRPIRTIVESIETISAATSMLDSAIHL